MGGSNDFMKLVEQVGVAVAIIAMFFIPLAWFFIRRDQHRETKLGQRLDAREDEIRSARESHIRDLRSIVINNTEAVQALKNTVSLWSDRPCLWEKEHDNVRESRNKRDE